MLLADENLRSVGETLANLQDGLRRPARSVDARGAALATDLRRTAAETASSRPACGRPWTERSRTCTRRRCASARSASDKLARTADSLDRIVAGNEADAEAVLRAAAWRNCSNW